MTGPNKERGITYVWSMLTIAALVVVRTGTVRSPETTCKPYQTLIDPFTGAVGEVKLCTSGEYRFFKISTVTGGKKNVPK